MPGLKLERPEIRRDQPARLRRATQAWCMPPPPPSAPASGRRTAPAHPPTTHDGCTRDAVAVLPRLQARTQPTVKRVPTEPVVPRTRACVPRPPQPPTTHSDPMCPILPPAAATRRARTDLPSALRSIKKEACTNNIHTYKV
jgi:hypothetical protein